MPGRDDISPLFDAEIREWENTLFDFDTSGLSQKDIEDNRARVNVLRRLLAVLFYGDVRVNGELPDKRIPIGWYLAHGGRIVIDASLLGKDAEELERYLKQGAESKFFTRFSTHGIGSKPVKLLGGETRQAEKHVTKVASFFIGIATFFRWLGNKVIGKKFKANNQGMDVAIGGLNKTRIDPTDPQKKNPIKDKKGIPIRIKNDGHFGHLYVGRSDDGKCLIVGIENSAPRKKNFLTRVGHDASAKRGKVSAFSLPKLDDPADPHRIPAGANGMLTEDQLSYIETFKRRMGYPPTATLYNWCSVKVDATCLRKLRERVNGIDEEDLSRAPLNAKEVTRANSRETAFIDFAKRNSEVNNGSIVDFRPIQWVPYQSQERKTNLLTSESQSIIKKTWNITDDEATEKKEERKKHEKVSNVEILTQKIGRVRLTANKTYISLKGLNEDEQSREAAIKKALDGLIFSQLGMMPDENNRLSVPSQKIGITLVGTREQRQAVYNITQQEPYSDFVQVTLESIVDLESEGIREHQRRQDLKETFSRTQQLESRGNDEEFDEILGSLLKALSIKNFDTNETISHQQLVDGLIKYTAYVGAKARYKKDPINNGDPGELPKEISTITTRVKLRGFDDPTLEHLLEIDPFIERGKSFLDAAKLLYKYSIKDTSDAEEKKLALNKQLNKAFRDFEKKFIYLSSNEDKKEALQIFLCHISLLIAKATAREQKNVYKDLMLAEAFSIWDEGREPLCTKVHYVNARDGKSCTVLQIEDPIVEITLEQYNELTKIFTANLPQWFIDLPEFAQKYLREKLINNEGNGIANFAAVQGRCKTMPSLLKRIPGLANYSTHTLVILDEQGNEIRRSSIYRSSSAAPNEIDNPKEMQRLTTQNMRQVFNHANAPAFLEKYWGIKADEIQNAEKVFQKRLKLGGDTYGFTRLMLAQTVLAPTTGDRIQKDGALVDYKNNAIEQLRNDELFQENTLMASNHVINNFKSGPTSVITVRKREDLNNRSNTYQYLAHFWMLSYVFAQQKNEDFSAKQPYEWMMNSVKELLDVLVDNDEDMLPIGEQDVFSKFNKRVLQVRRVLESRIHMESPQKGKIINQYRLSLNALHDYILLTNLPREGGGLDRNPDAWRGALSLIYVESMGGVVHLTCLSGKDRTGFEILLADAMLTFDAIYGHLPNYFNDADWKTLVDITAELFLSQHQQRNASQNAPGSRGLKSLGGMVPKEMKQAIIQKAKERGIDNIWGNNKAYASINRPDNLLSTKFNIKSPGKSLKKKISRLTGEYVTFKKKCEKEIQEFQSNDKPKEILINMIINPKVVELILKDKRTYVHATYGQIEAINQAIFDPLITSDELKRRLQEIGLQFTGKEWEEIWRTNCQIRERILQSREHDESTLVKVWEYAERNSDFVRETPLWAILYFPSSSQFVRAKGILKIVENSEEVREIYEEHKKDLLSASNKEFDDRGIVLTSRRSSFYRSSSSLWKSEEGVQKDSSHGQSQNLSNSKTQQT